MRAAREAFGSLDIVVNCEALAPSCRSPSCLPRSGEPCTSVTLGGVFDGVKQGARQMLEQGRPGVIINISSVNGTATEARGNAAYCAAERPAST